MAPVAVETNLYVAYHKPQHHVWLCEYLLSINNGILFLDVCMYHIMFFKLFASFYINVRTRSSVVGINSVVRGIFCGLRARAQAKQITYGKNIVITSWQYQYQINNMVRAWHNARGIYGVKQYLPSPGRAHGARYGA